MKTTYAAMALALAAGLMGCSSANTDSLATNKDSRPNTLNNNPNYPDDPKVVAADKPADLLNGLDRNFVQQAANGGAYEIQSSQLALGKSTDAGIKKIAQRLIDDHTKLGAQLNALAKDKGMNVNGIPDNDQQKWLDKLSGLSGAEFDKEYLRQQERAHQSTLVAFQQEDRMGKDLQLHNFAGKSIPMLAEHLKMVQNQSTGSMVGTDNP